MRRWKLLGLVCSLGLVASACGTDGSEEPVHAAAGPSMAIDEMPFLQWVASGGSASVIGTPVQGGAVLFAGLDPSGRGPTDSPWSGMGAALSEDGSGRMLPEPPIKGTLVEPSLSTFDDVLHLSGTDCLEPRMDDELGGGLVCDELIPVLLRLDLSALTWSEIGLPSDASAIGGQPSVRDVYTLAEDTVAYVSREDGRSWATTDGGDTWADLELPDGVLCASRGELLVVEEGNELKGGTGTGEEPLEDMEIVASVVNLEDGGSIASTATPQPIKVLPGATSIACTPNAGVVVVAMTAQVSDPIITGSVLSFRGTEGWSAAVSGEFGLSHPIPLSGSSLALETFARSSDASMLVAVDAPTGVSTGVELGGRSVLVGLGSSRVVAMRSDRSQLEVIEL